MKGRPTGSAWRSQVGQATGISPSPHALSLKFSRLGHDHRKSTRVRTMPWQSAEALGRCRAEHM